MAGETAFLPVLLLILVLAGLALRLPAGLVFAGGAMLGAFLGQLLGVYNIVLLGDLASEVESVLNNETLVAIPLLVLTGSLMEGAAGFSGLRSRLGARAGVFADLLLASSGGGGRSDRGFIALLERAAPASAFLVLLGELIDRAYLAADLPSMQNSRIPDSTASLMLCLALPVLLLTVLRIFLDGRPSEDMEAPAAGRTLPVLFAAVIGILVPALILTGLASPAESGAVGVVLTLSLKALGGDFSLASLGAALDRALLRAADPFVTLIAGQAFLLVFEGIGGGGVLQEPFRLLSEANTLSLLAIVIPLLAILGLLVEPIALAVLCLPQLGPFLLEQGLSIQQLGALFVLSPLAGLVFAHAKGVRFLLPMAQAAMLALALLLPPWDVLRPLSAPEVENVLPAENPEEGFTPEDNGDEVGQGDEEDQEFDPPSENE
jgi:hypothetical protein